MKLIWTTIGIFFVLFVAAIFKWGIAPRAVKLIDPSEFDEPQEMGAALYNRLRQEIALNRVVIMGGKSPLHQAIATGFLRRAQSDSRPFEHIWVDDATLPLAVERQIGDMKESLEEITQKIARLPDGERFFLYTDFVYATHQLPSNPIHHLEAELKRPVMSISLATLASKVEELEKLEFPCRGLADDRELTARLGCLIAARARPVFRRKLNWNRYVMLMDQQGTADYLALARAPE